MTRSPAQLEARLARAESRLATLEGRQHAPDEMLAHFPLGSVGGSGRRTRDLNARRSRDLDATIDRALKIERLRAEVVDLQHKLARARQPARPKPAAAKKRQVAYDPARHDRLLDLLDWAMYNNGQEPCPDPTLDYDAFEREMERAERIPRAVHLEAIAARTHFRAWYDLAFALGLGMEGCFMDICQAAFLVRTGGRVQLVGPGPCRYALSGQDRTEPLTFPITPADFWAQVDALAPGCLETDPD